MFFFVLRRFNIGFIFENLYLFWSTYLSCFYFGSGFWCFTAPKMPVVFKLLLDKLLPFRLPMATWRPKTSSLRRDLGISWDAYYPVGFALFSQASAPENGDFCGPQNGKGHPKSSLEKKDFKGAFAVSFGGGTLPPTCFLSGEWDVSKIRFFSMRVIFHFHDSWRKGYV